MNISLSKIELVQKLLVEVLVDSELVLPDPGRALVLLGWADVVAAGIVGDGGGVIAGQILGGIKLFH